MTFDTILEGLPVNVTFSVHEDQIEDIEITVFYYSIPPVERSEILRQCREHAAKNPFDPPTREPKPVELFAAEKAAKARGLRIECKTPSMDWFSSTTPTWNPEHLYRIAK